MLSPMMQCAGRIRVKDCPFGAPDGTANQFQLVDRHGHAVTKDVRIASIHQTDWQGRVELSDQPRTNLWGNNQQHAGSYGYGQHIALYPDPDYPDENYIAVTRTNDSRNPNGREGALLNVNGLSVGATYAIALSLDAPSDVAVSFRTQGGGVSLVGNPDGVVAGATPVRVQLQFIANESSGQVCFYTTGADVPSGTVFNVRRIENESGEDVGAYIPTTDSPRTLTDYTHDGQGGITLGQVPDADATLDWTGSARRAA